VITVHSQTESNPNEITQYSPHDQIQQSQIDFLRRQLQTLMQKEKMYKYEITNLKQRFSHR